MFAKGDLAAGAALAKHVPPNISAQRHLAYGYQTEEFFDINWPQEKMEARPTIVWVHGGGWIGGSTEGVANYLKVLAGCGYTTVAVEYSISYGSRYPRPSSR